MKKIGKVFLWILIGFIALDLILVGMLFVPAIQTFAVNKLTTSISEKWGSEISIKDVHITPTLKLVAHDFKLCDNRNKPMITAETVKGRLLSFTIKPLKLKFGDLELDNADVVLRKYKGEESVNISLWAQKIKKEKKEKGTLLLTAKNLKLNNSRFVLINDERRVVFDTKDQPDIDYGYLELKDINIDANKFAVKADKIVNISMDFNHLAFNQYGGFSLTDGQAAFSICDTALVMDKMHFVTPNSNLDMDLKFQYDEWHQLGDFVDSVRIVSTIRPTTLSMKDVAGFAPALKGMNETFSISADRFDGVVSDFKLINFLARWGMGNQLHGDLALKNVTDFKHADITLELDSSNVNVPELANFTLPKGKTININKTIAKFGNTALKGSFAGTLSEFDAAIDAVSGLGTLFANLGTVVDNNGKMHLEGSVASPNLNLAKLTGKGKLLGSTDVFVSFDGDMKSSSLDAENFQTLQAHFDGDIQYVDLYGYRLRYTTIEGDYKDKLYNATISSSDPNFDCNILAQLDLTDELPSLQGNISLDHLYASAVAKKMHTVDSASAKGFDKLVYAVQRNPNLSFSFDNFMVALRGNKLENVNGYAGCDNIVIRSNEDSLSNDRLRITAINTDNDHKFILSSGIANATIETSYPITEIKNTLQAFAHIYFPTLVHDAPTHTLNALADKKNGFLKAHLTTYRTYNITKLLIPNVFIAPNCNIDLAISDDHNMDKLEANIPFFGIRKKMFIYNLDVNGNTSGSEHIKLAVAADSTVVVLGKSTIALKEVDMDAQAHDDTISYQVNWRDKFNTGSSRSQLSGIADVSNPNDIVFNLINSSLYLNDLDWKFNNDNAVHIQNGTIAVDSLIFFHDQSKLVANGKYAKKSDEKLSVFVERINLEILNSVFDQMNLSGDVSADITIICPQNKPIVFGKTLLDNFSFNQEPVGDILAVAGLDTAGNVGFTGGIYKGHIASAESKLSEFNFQNQNTDDIIARLNGRYITDKKDLVIRTSFDTLNAGFLSSFLSGFSNQFSGTASGNLSIFINPEAKYFDGTVRAVDINMGIAPLGTIYNVKNQDIRFNREGIFFDKMRITDKEGNTAFMDGSIKHKFFKDMNIDLNIKTDRIMALNTPKDQTSVFYGNGFVSGDVTIRGDGKTISFRGPNLKTLTGSRIVLQVTSANSTSQSNVIHFKPKETLASTPTEPIISTDNRTKLDFDFTFNVTNDADVVLYLESIGGTMNARADGKFQLTYSDNEDLNLYGNLGIHSGDFKISLFNVVNSRFTLVPGGSIQFDGPLENMLVNVSAYKTSKASLAEIIPQENVGNGVNVNAYLHLNGPLMQRIEPTFSFELPNSSEEVNNLFYTAIDTTNTENLTKQFAYFMVTNNFMPATMFSADRAGGGLGASGINMFRNIVNNMLGNLLSSRNGSFGITYNQATETTSAEYGVTGSATLKDRVTMETSIGYYDDQSTQGINNMYGDFTVEYNINKEGTWKLKAYTYIGERDENYVLHNDQLNYTAGVALAYKQDFNSVRRKNKSPKKDKKQKKNEK